jgi:hypothetical protein
MQDLSSKAKNSLIAGSSMGGGNTISETPWGKLPESTSEATQDVDTHGTPDIDEGTSTDKYQTLTHGDGYSPAPLTWKKLK